MKNCRWRSTTSWTAAGSTASRPALDEHRTVALRPAAPALDRRHARERRRRGRRRRSRSVDVATATVAVAIHVPVAEVEEFRTQGAIGSGFLQAYVDDHWVDLARYPNAEADRFAPRRPLPGRPAHRRARSKSTPTPPPTVTHCPKCGQRLPEVNESCPRCIPRKAILGRLAQMLWPYRATAAVMCGLMLVAVAAELVPPKLQQYLVDDILNGGQRDARSAVARHGAARRGAGAGRGARAC